MRNIKIYSRSASLRKKKSINAMTVGEIAEGKEAKEDARNREKNTSRPDVSFFPDCNSDFAQNTNNTNSH